MGAATIRTAFLFCAALAVYAATGPAHLTWVAPTKNCDGSTLTKPITAYKIYWGSVGRVAAGITPTPNACGTSSGVLATDPKVKIAYPNVATVAAPALVTDIALPADGKLYYFAGTAVNADGESILTNEVSKLADPAPVAPTFTASTCPLCSQFTSMTVWSAVTGQTINLNWVAQTAPVTVSVMEFPAKAGAVATESRTFAAGITTWAWVPIHAGAYYTRICAGTACTDNASVVYHLKLAPVGGIGIN